MKCEYCGKELNDNAQFCTNCGHSTENVTEETDNSQKPKKGAYFFSVLTLIIVLALVGLGGFRIIDRDLHPEKFGLTAEAASASDHGGIDGQLIGKWLCTDPAAADYKDTDHGIEIRAILSLSEDGAFTLNYELTNAGILAKALTVNGSYATEDGMITFFPDNATEAKKFFKNHGENPSFVYSVEKNIFTLTYENGKEIIFTAAEN